MGEQTTDANRDFIVIAGGALLLILYKFSQSKEFNDLLTSLPRTLLLIFTITCFLSGTLLLFVTLWRKRQMHKEQHYEQQMILLQVKAFRTTKYENSESLMNDYIKLSSLHEELLPKYRHQSRYAKKQLLLRSRILDEQRIERVAQERENNEQKERLIAYFLKHRSKTLPRWAIHFEQSVIATATEQYDTHKKKEAHKREIQRIHTEQRRQVVDDFLLEHSFYHVEKLTIKQRQALLTNGYRFIPFVHLDGRPGNNLIIRNDTKKESDYHFCMKHLFAELSEHARIEHPLGGFRFDVVIPISLHRIALEIETGKNKPEQIKKKIAALNQYFEYWIIVCARQQKKHYRAFVDNEKSFCLTSKEAAKQVQTTLSLLQSKPTAAKATTHR